MFNWFFNLFKPKPEPEIVAICMRQANTWHWPDHLDEKTSGECSECQAPIFFEKKNGKYKKICHICAYG